MTSPAALRRVKTTFWKSQRRVLEGKVGDWLGLPLHMSRTLVRAPTWARTPGEPFGASQASSERRTYCCAWKPRLSVATFPTIRRRHQSAISPAKTSRRRSFRLTCRKVSCIAMKATMVSVAANGVVCPMASRPEPATPKSKRQLLIQPACFGPVHGPKRPLHSGPDW